MIVNTMRRRSGLYDVWVYFPRTLISSLRQDEPSSWKPGDLSDDRAQYNPGRLEFTQGSNTGNILCLPDLRKYVPVTQMAIHKSYL